LSGAQTQIWIRFEWRLQAKAPLIKIDGGVSTFFPPPFPERPLHLLEQRQTSRCNPRVQTGGGGGDGTALFVVINQQILDEFFFSYLLCKFF
jgi:hypothetical protein